MRDDVWLHDKLNYVWNEYFSDVERKNQVIIKFGTKARTRLGSIRYHKNSASIKHPITEIRLTSYFKNPIVPEYIIDLTIAHELCHYTHGFFSSHPALSKFPHRGKIVDRELKKRGLDKLSQMQKIWFKENWLNIISQHKKRLPKRRKTKVLIKIIFGV